MKGESRRPKEEDANPKPLDLTPIQQVMMQLQALFEPGEQVNLSIHAKWDEKQHKWQPADGGTCYERDELISLLQQNGCGGVMDGFEPEAGAWLCQNPTDGTGRGIKRTMAWRHALIESDNLPIKDQVRIMRELDLPITTMTLSGGKSVHALVRVDADGPNHYDERVMLLHEICNEAGLKVDPSNKDSSRLTRLAGIRRRTQRQTLLYTNIGAKDFRKWLEAHRHKPEDDEDGQDAVQRFENLFKPMPAGMHLAYAAAGGHCVYSSEWDKWCQLQYRQNFGIEPDGDITKVNARDIPDHDILAAGFPCQPFSIAGVSKKNSLGRATGFLDEAQGTLFFDVARILDEKRPPAFMLENVKNLMSHDHGNTWRVIQGTLKDLGYIIFPKVLNGDGFVPQHRERIIIVGFDKKRFGNNVEFTFDIEYPEDKPRLRDILDDEVPERYILTNHLWEYLQNYAAKHKAKGNGFGYGMPDLNGSSRTLSARYYKDGSEILIRRGEGENPRRLTPRECARLQGYPDEYRIVVSDTQAYKQFGNSVVVPLMEQVASLVVQKLGDLGADITRA